MDFNVPKIVENQLEPGEQPIWIGHPESGAMTVKVLTVCTLILGAVYAESVSMIANATADQQELVIARSLGLALSVAVSAYLICRVPRRAARTIYCVTNRRVLKLDLNRTVHRNAVKRSQHLRQSILYEKRSLPEGFWLNLATVSYMFCGWLAASVATAAQTGDAFVSIATVLVMAAVLAFTYDRHYLPNAKWRDAGGVLYWIDNRSVYLQDLRLNDVCDVKVRNSVNGANDLFIMSKTSGCIRMPSVSKNATPKDLLSKFGALPNAATDLG